MARTNEDSISVLNDLIETLKDGQQGYQTAAEDVKDSQLKDLFQQYSKQRTEYIAELRKEIVRLGGDPESGGSVSGAMHRGWIDIKSAVTDRDDHAILSECERGEDVAVDNYKDALNDEELDNSYKAIISRQYDGIKEAHDRIRSLRDSTK